MKKIYRSVSSFTAWLSALGLSLLGYSCSNDAPVMYGTPTGTYEINGSVTTEDGKPVENASIRELPLITLQVYTPILLLLQIKKGLMKLTEVAHPVI